MEVQVLLQAMKEDPPPDARCRDKFLVQSVAVRADQEVGNVTQIWTNIEQTAKSSIQEKKIRVSFLAADGSEGTGAAILGRGAHSANGHDDELAPPYSSPSPAAVTPQKGSTREAVGPISTPSDRPADATNRGEAVASAHNSAAQQSTVGAAVAAVTNAIPTNKDQLQQQLDAANAQIKSLQQQAMDGLRQRKPAEGGEKSASSSLGLQNAPAPGGVPIQIAALLCLVSFLIAYMFF